MDTTTKRITFKTIKLKFVNFYPIDSPYLCDTNKVYIYNKVYTYCFSRKHLKNVYVILDTTQNVETFKPCYICDIPVHHIIFFIRTPT